MESFSLIAQCPMADTVPCPQWMSDKSFNISFCLRLGLDLDFDKLLFMMRKLVYLSSLILLFLFCNGIWGTLVETQLEVLFFPY